MDNVLDSALIAKSLNYHGQQLKKAWESERGEHDLQRLGVENVDFAVFQERQKYLGFQDRGKRLKLHQFISKNANVLFDEVLNVRVPLPKVPQSPVGGELCAEMPPYDVFAADIDKKDRTEHFFACVKPGDIIYGSLITKLSTGYLMKVAYSEGETTRIVADLSIKAIIHSVNLIPAMDKKNVTRSFLINDLVCAEVLEVVTSSEKIYAGMKGDVCDSSARSKLGLIHSEDLPASYRMWQEGITETYDEVLNNSVGFQNPGNIKHLSQELGLGNQQYSNFPVLRFGFPTEECAAELRQAQSSKWAYRSVSDGIAHFKAGRHTEAFQCLNKALTIDANNIEALVARGALYANGGTFKKAIDDFDAALKINSNHQNARKYLAETLVAYGRSYEDDSKWDEALAAYERCLSIIPFHEEAKNSIEYIKNKQGLGRQNEVETIPLITPIKAQGVKEALKHLLVQHEGKSNKKKKKKEKKPKHKKARSRSSSTSSSSSSSSSTSSSSSSTDSSTASSQDSHHKKKHKRKSEHKDRSLSPLSKRMALMEPGVEGFDGIGSQKGSHYNPPSMPYSFSAQPAAIIPPDPLRPVAKSNTENEYELRVRKFLEQTKGDDDYEEKVRKFLEETAKWKKERKAQEEKKKKKKKDKKLNKKNRKKKREEKKKLKKAAKEEKMTREGKRRRSNSNVDDEEYGSKTDISRIFSLDKIHDLEALQTRLSAYYAKVDKAPKKRESSEDKLFKTRKSSLSPKSFDRNEKSSSHDSLRKGKKAVDMFEEESPESSPEREKTCQPEIQSPPPQQKFKMQLTGSSNKFKKKDKTDDPISEAWDDIEEKGSSLLKDVVPPPLPPTKDEMAQNLKKIVEKKKEAVEAKPAAAPGTLTTTTTTTTAAAASTPVAATGGPSVMDKLGGFRINPAAVSTNNSYRKEDDSEGKRKPSRTRDSDSDSERDEKDKGSLSSRSRSRSPKRKYSSGESSEVSYKGRSRSKSGSYTRPRRYRSSESGSYRSRSYSRSRSRSRSGDYRRSRSRSDDRSYRSKYPPGRYPRNRGTYYRPRFQNSGNFKNRGYGNRMGYRRGGYGGGYRDYGSRDYRNRGFNPRNRGRGRGQRYFGHRRDYRDYKRHDRGGSRSDDDRDDSPMRKVDAAKERIDKLISQEHSGPLSEGEDRDEDYKWGGGSTKDESNPNTSTEKI